MLQSHSKLSIDDTHSAKAALGDEIKAAATAKSCTAAQVALAWVIVDVVSSRFVPE